MMILGVVLTTLVIGTGGGQSNWAAVMERPFVVQAVIDAARIIGLPSSKAAKAYALKIQSPDPTLRLVTITSDPVSDRKLFFRNYFQ